MKKCFFINFVLIVLLFISCTYEETVTVKNTNIQGDGSLLSYIDDDYGTDEALREKLLNFAVFEGYKRTEDETVKEIEDFVTAFRSTSSTSEKSLKAPRYSITIAESKEISFENENIINTLTSKDITSIPVSEEENIYLNIYDVANNDTGENCFIIIPNDKRFGDVLFISDSGTWDESKDNEIMQLIVESMKEKIQETMGMWNSLTEEEIENEKSKYGLSKEITYYSKFYRKYGSWSSKETNIITTQNFAQDGIYNDVIEKVKGTGMLAGCGPIAVSIVLTSLKLPESFVEYTENGREATLSKIKTVWSSASSWNGKYDWNAIQNGTNNFQTAALIFGVAEHMEAKYGTGATSITTNGIGRVLNNFGLTYDTAMMIDPTNLVYTKNAANHLKIINSLENKSPVIVSAWTSDFKGHVFVIDGGKFMFRTISTKLYVVASKINESIYDSYEGKDIYYHCNLGWGGSSNGWYSPDAVTSLSLNGEYYVYNIKRK